MIARVVFASLVVVAFASFAHAVARVVAALRRARPARPAGGTFGARLRDVLVYFLLQKKVLERAPVPAARGAGFVRWLGSRYHLILFWGFLIISVGSAEFLVAGIVPSWTFDRALPARAAAVLRGVLDLANGLVLGAVALAVFRRLVLRPRLIPMSRDAALVLAGIALLCASHFAMQAAAPTPAAAASWVHLIVLLAFLNYLVHSKHSHILAALPNIWFRDRGPRGVPPRLDLEADDLAKTGVVSGVHDFTWKSLLDGFACTECARCTNQCPAFATGKPLSPMQVVHDLRDDLVARAPVGGLLGALATHAAPRAKDDAAPLVGGRTSEDALWACTTCGACLEACPVFIDQPEKILAMRRNLVLLQEKAPAELARTYKNLEQNGNPWGLGADQRLGWAAGADVPTLEDRPDAEWLLWIGCAGAYDDRIKKQTLALIEILREGGVDFAVLGAETCTGDPARRTGNELLYELHARENVAALNAAKVRKVIAACPHCLHTIKNEYPQLGGTFEVRHHTQVIRELIDAGRVVVRRDADGVRRVAFHDPCYLGRWNGEYEAPRAGLAAIAGEVVEAPRRREQSFCCGAGGGRMWMEEKIGGRINHERVDELLATGAETVATACPFCTIMLRDGVADRGAAERVNVLNVSELIAASMVRKRTVAPAVAPAAPSQPPEDRGG